MKRVYVITSTQDNSNPTTFFTGQSKTFAVKYTGKAPSWGTNTQRVLEFDSISQAEDFLGKEMPLAIGHYYQIEPVYRTDARPAKTQKGLAGCLEDVLDRTINS